MEDYYPAGGQPHAPKDIWAGNGSRRCIVCKGARALCGRERCPIVEKHYASMRVSPLLDSTGLSGSSPPSVFIGRHGYPRVSVGPMIPPVAGDTSLLDMPELWTGCTIDDIISFRSQLVRGKYAVDAHDVENESKIVAITREIALAEKPVDADAVFSSKPRGSIALFEDAQPYGPSASLLQLDAGNMRYNPKIEKAYHDTDLRAADALAALYGRGVPVSQIQKAFSVGAFGLGGNRRFVPTRWSITAVDSTLSERLMESTRAFPLINECRAYVHEHLDNRWIVLMVPRPWSYELVEAWYPGTAWNAGDSVEMMSDSEGFSGRAAYARIGGCYYAARLAVNELLNRERRQASVVVLREAHPGYILPVGVWNVRENVRKALEDKPLVFSSLKEALMLVGRTMDIPVQKWILASAVLRNSLYQRRISDF